jgi:hypothetical protein
MKCARPCSKNLIGLKRELNRWRRSQPGRAALPEAMWQSAAALARTNGVGAVARILRLDYYKLKRLAPSPLPALVSVVPPGFVELTLSPPASQASVCRIELEDRTGAKVRMVAPGDVGTLVVLAQAFWGRGA